MTVKVYRSPSKLAYGQISMQQLRSQQLLITARPFSDMAQLTMEHCARARCLCRFGRVFRSRPIPVVWVASTMHERSSAHKRTQRIP